MNNEIMTATLDVTELRKQFSIGRPAIDGVSFAVPAGEIVVRLCRAAAPRPCATGLASDRETQRLRPVRRPRADTRAAAPRELGMFQSYAVRMTVRQNVVYPLKHVRSRVPKPA